MINIIIINRQRAYTHVTGLIIFLRQESYCYDGFQHRPVSPSGGVSQDLQQKRAQRVAEVQHAAEVELEGLRQAGGAGRKKPPRISPTNRSPASPSNNIPMSPTDVKAKNTGIIN